MANKLWGGRFKKKPDAQFEAFSSSFRWDKRLLAHDLKIDAAHVKALSKCGVLSSLEAKKLLLAIALLEKRRQKGSLKLNEHSEDVHSAVHAQLKDLVGDLADKLHTGRSRNDLVSQSTRLYCKEQIDLLLSQVSRLQKEIVLKAEKYRQLLVPGMTHLQNAQVISQGHIFLAYVEMLERAKFRLEGGKVLCDVCVLGSGALGGVTFKLDQKLIAKELGLSKITPNSYDVSGDRDFALNLLSCILLTGLELSRIAEDLMLGQTRGFGWADIDQAFCTGSSMMPQKKNADFVELARGAAGVFMGNFLGMATTLKALPTSYNRDLQWDKKYLFDSVEHVTQLLEIFVKVFRTLRIHEQRAQELLSDESLYATDLADMLVGKGVPFKEAHDQVGQIVSFAEERGLPLSKIGLDILKSFAPRLDGNVYTLFDPRHSVLMKKTAGSTHLSEVKKQIQFWKKQLRGV
jgi:argininosuccinate lyase